VLERTPPELTADIYNSGILMTGGGALLDGLPELISRRIGVPVSLADDPASCVAIGAGRALTMISKLGAAMTRAR